MKNRLFLALVVLISSCKKVDDYGALEIPQSSTGNAFVLKNSFIDSVEKEDFYTLEYPYPMDSSIIDSTFDSSKFFFDLKIDFAFLKNFELSESNSNPSLDSNFRFPSEIHILDRNIELNFIDGIDALPNYTNLVMLDAKRDANPMHFASLGFFLEQYINQSLESDPRQIMLGYYNNLDKTVSIEKDKKEMMQVFYESTRNPSKQTFQPFDNITSNALLDQIEAALASPTANLPVKSQLTIITYTLFDPVNIDTTRIKAIAETLNEKQVSLNIISLFPVYFIQPLVQGSGGFLSHEVYYLQENTNLSTIPDIFEEIVEKGYFSSSIAVQNMDLLIQGNQGNELNRFSISCEFTSELELSLTDYKEQLSKLDFKVEWRSNENRLPLEFAVKPEIK